MNARDIVSVQALESHAFALAARLHVILRREQGRITDIEYMRHNAGYCRHVIGLIDSEAGEDVRALGLKLEELYLGPHGIFTRLAPPAAIMPAAVDPVHLAPPPKLASKKDYIGHLR